MSIERHKNAYIQRAAVAAATIILTTKPHTRDSEDTHYICSQKEKIEWEKYENMETEEKSEPGGGRERAKEMVFNRSRHIASNIDIWFSHFLILFRRFFQLFHPSVSVDSFISFSFACNAFGSNQFSFVHTEHVHITSNCSIAFGVQCFSFVKLFCLFYFAHRFQFSIAISVSSAMNHIVSFAFVILAEYFFQDFKQLSINAQNIHSAYQNWRFFPLHVCTIIAW